MNRGYRAGKFERSQVIRAFQNLCPDEAELNLIDIDLTRLWQEGKRLILIDVDNTLLPWKGEDFPAEVLAWVQEGKELGLKFCLISNTRNLDRLKRLAHRLDVASVQGKFKPSRSMFRAALHQFKVDKDQTVMVGDQLFTDVLGANRSGIDSIWVRPMTTKEFIGTKFNRAAEKVVRRSLYRALDETDDDFDLLPKTGLFQRKVTRQFAKFCVIGGTSFVIDYCIAQSLMFAVPWGGESLSIVAGQWMRDHLPSWMQWGESARDAFFPVAKTLGAAVAIVNSFLLNRRWTFKITGAEDRLAQFRRFLVISLVGMVLNVVISSNLNYALPFDEKNSARVAIIVAALIVAVWNFLGQRLYAFRPRAAE